jgi:hypothetical protein
MSVRLLSLLWTRFTPLETRLFDHVRAVLPETARPVYDAQVAAINRVQRLPPSWSEIDCYCMRRGRPDWSGVPPFARTDEFRLAEVRFSVAGAGYRAVLSCIAGHVFDFAIVPGPKAIAFAEWDEPARSILLSDPGRAPAGRSKPPVLPPAWEAFMARHGERPPAGWALHDAGHARRVALEDGEYLILAERGAEEFVLHRIEPPADGFFHLRGYDETPVRLSGELDRVVR